METITVNNKSFNIVKLLGKGKGVTKIHKKTQVKTDHAHLVNS